MPSALYVPGRGELVPGEDRDLLQSTVVPGEAVAVEHIIHARHIFAEAGPNLRKPRVSVPVA